MNTETYPIHRRLAEEMDGRLQILTRTPQRIILCGADGDHSRRLLAARYPQARMSEYDPRPDFLRDAAAARKSGLLAKLAGKSVPQHCQALDAPLPEAAADMLWSNLCLLIAEAAVPVIGNWAHALNDGGLLFFSHLGADSLADVRHLLQQQGISCPAPLLCDMHDLGDMLFHNGFLDPVMDTAKLVLSYRSESGLLADWDSLGLWSALQCPDTDAARQAVQTLWQDGHLREITLETVFGHAVRRPRQPENIRPIHFYPPRR